MRHLLLLALLPLVACGEIARDTRMADRADVRRAMLDSVEIGRTTDDAFVLRWGPPHQKQREGGRTAFVYRSQLQSELDDWFDDMQSSGELRRLLDKYYGFVEVFDYVDIRTFIRRIEKRLPKYEPLFRTAAGRHDMDWTLLAAQSYQESHWNPKARSPTGVRGMMMLTQNTARELGVKSRIDAKQSIEGGAKYLTRLRERLPESVTGPDRTWLALAAYNIGMGHLYDARQLARELGHDPDRWSELAQVLPLLAQKRYYRQLKHGYARGYEPVRYVAQIRNYHDILLNTLNPAGGGGQ